MRTFVLLTVATFLSVAAQRVFADIPPELTHHVWTDSPDATARVVGVIDSPDAEPAAIQVIAPASAVVRFGPPAPDAPAPHGGTPQDLPIGTDPEGDVPTDVEYHPSGASFFILHRASRNIVRFDATTNLPIQTYALSGQLPVAMDITPDGARLVVAYFTEDLFAVIDTATGAESTIATGNAPGTVDITPDGARALIGCVMDNTLRVINLSTLAEERSITTPAYTQVISFGLESGVADLNFPSPVRFLDASRIVFPGRFNSLVAVIDFTTGARTDIPTAASPAGAAVSANGAVIAVSHSASNGITTIIDPTTLTVSRTVNSPGSSTFANGPIVLNSTGTRAVIAFQNAARWLDLTNDTFGPALTTTFNLEDLLVNAAGTRVVGVGFSGAIIDFATGNVIGSPNGTVSCTRGAVSPIADRAVLASWPTFGDDMVVLDTDATPSQIFFGRTANTPEGDVSRNAAVSPNGSLAVSSNLYSDNLAIFDTATGALLRYGALDSRPGEVEITPDNTRAVGVNLDGFTVSVVNLATGATVAVPSATRLAQVEIDPAGAFAYFSQVASGDGVRKLNLATNTFVGGITPTADMGGVGYAYSQNSQIALSPDGTLLAVPGAFNDRFDLVNTTTMTVAQTFPLGTFITRVSWSPEGDEVLVTDRDADSVHVFRRPSPTDPFAQVGTIAVGDFPFDTVALPASNRAFVINFGTSPSIGVLNTTTLTQTNTIPVTANPVGMSLNAEGSTLTVLCANETTTIGGGNYTRTVSGQLTFIDTASLAVSGTVATNQAASMLAADAAGNTLACPGMSSEVLTLIAPSIQVCDIDGDGDIDGDDQTIFIAVLLGSDTNPDHIQRSDISGDGFADGLDVTGFVQCRVAP